MKKSNNISNIIAISNHKGGVGKTTSTINIGAGLAKLGKQILLIDIDPQANLSQSLRIHDEKHNTYEALRGKEVSVTNVIKNLDIIPSTLDLSGAEIELSSETGREYVLQEMLSKISKTYDYILIDCPPSLGLLTINAFTAAESVYIPLQAEYLAFQGLSKLTEVILKIKKRLNSKIEISGVFITQYDHRKILNRDIVESITKHFGDAVFKTKIRDNIAIAEAPSAGLDIFRYAPDSYGADDYNGLCKEILKKHCKTK